MQEPLNILLLEDNQAISESYRRAFESEGGVVFHAHDYDEAVKILDENPSVAFDLFFTDIDLVGDRERKVNKSEISFTRYARKIVPDVPILGHSAYFDDNDITSEEKALFDEWFPKSMKITEREAMFEKALALARERHKEQTARASEDLPPAMLNSLHVPATDREFADSGYEKESVSADKIEGSVKPFSTWVRQSEDGWEIEVVGCPALLAWGEDKEEALGHLIEFINSNRDLAELPNEKLRGSGLQIARFIQDLFGTGEVS